jgi:hypothetical protein
METMPTPFNEGDLALISHGPFAGKIGMITRIDSESATVICDVFDRDTPVDVSRGDLEPPPNPGSSGDTNPLPPLPPTGSTSAAADLN